MTATATQPEAPQGPTEAPARRKRLRAPRPPRAGAPLTPVKPGEPGEAVSLVSSACILVALVCAWMLLQMLVLGGLAEQRSQHLLYSQFRAELAQATSPTGELDYDNNPVQPGSPVALMTIPALHTQQVVVDGTASGDLMSGPGHLRDTPMPGEVGDSVVLGRGSTYGAPFGDLDQLHAGDTISVVGAQGTTTYTVVDVRGSGDPIPAQPTGSTAGRLILVSAKSSGFLSALRPKSAIYVDADTTKARPDGAVAATVPPAEEIMKNDPSALPMLVLLLAGLAALVLGVTVALRRFKAVLVWLAATPVAVALAWSVTDQVMRLLPNLM